MIYFWKKNSPNCLKPPLQSTEKQQLTTITQKVSFIIFLLQKRLFFSQKMLKLRVHLSSLSRVFLFLWGKVQREMTEFGLLNPISSMGQAFRLPHTSPCFLNRENERFLLYEGCFVILPSKKLIILTTYLLHCYTPM